MQYRSPIVRFHMIPARLLATAFVPCVVPIQPSASLPPPDLPVVELPPIVGEYVQMYNITTVRGCLAFASYVCSIHSYSA